MLVKLIIFIAIGFILAKLLSGKKEGKQGVLKSFEFREGKYNIHLHHWSLSLVILIILLVFDYYDDVLYGLLIGLIIQGLTYKDFYKIVYKR